MRRNGVAASRVRVGVVACLRVCCLQRVVAVRVAEAASIGADVTFFVPDVVFALAKSLGPGARVRAGTDRRTLDLRLKDAYK